MEVNGSADVATHAAEAGTVVNVWRKGKRGSRLGAILQVTRLQDPFPPMTVLLILERPGKCLRSSHSAFNIVLRSLGVDFLISRSEGGTGGFKALDVCAAN